MRPLLVILLLALASPLSAQETARLQARMTAAMQTQRWDDVVTTARELIALRPEHEQAWFNLGYALHSKQKYAEALEAHVKASEYPNVGAIAAYNAACAHALLGQTDQAFEWLNESIDKGFGQLAQVRSDPDLASLRGDPRYTAVIEKLGGEQAAGDDDGRGPAPNVRVFAGTTDRKSSRLFYWTGSSSPGQVAVAYGPIEWKDEYAGLVDSDKLIGKRWRLGGNFWTTLDTNLDLTLGGVDVPAGMYYVTLEQQQPGEFVLHLNDPSKVRAKQLDAFFADQTSGGLEIPLEHSEADEIEQTLKIELQTLRGGDPRDGSLTIAFGTHRLEAELKTKM